MTKKPRVFVSEPGWFLNELGQSVVIQYWDHHAPAIPHRMRAFWRGMVVLEVEDSCIRDWECLWFTCHGDGWSPDYALPPVGMDQLVRKLESHEIPATEPLGWMPPAPPQPGGDNA